MNDTRRIHPRSALAVFPALALFAVMQACGGSDDAVAQQAAADPIEGVWEGTATLTHCTTGAVLATFSAASVYHRGGTMGDTNSSPAPSRGPGFGTWTRDGATYTIKFRFFAYDNTGALIGTRRVTRSVTLGPTGDDGDRHERQRALQPRRRLARQCLRHRHRNPRPVTPPDAELARLGDEQRLLVAAERHAVGAAEALGDDARGRDAARSSRKTAIVQAILLTMVSPRTMSRDGAAPPDGRR